MKRFRRKILHKEKDVQGTLISWIAILLIRSSQRGTSISAHTDAGMNSVKWPTTTFAWALKLMRRQPKHHSSLSFGIQVKRFTDSKLQFCWWFLIQFKFLWVQVIVFLILTHIREETFFFFLKTMIDIRPKVV